MTKKNGDETPDLEIAIRPQLLYRLIKAMDSYSSVHKGIIIEFYKAGMVLKSQSSDFTGMLMVAVNKSELNGYIVRDFNISLTLNDDHATKILDFCKDRKDTIPIVLTFKNSSQRINLQYANLHKHFMHVWNSNIFGGGKQIVETTTRFFKGKPRLGVVVAEPFDDVIQKINSMRKSQKTDYFTLTKPAQKEGLRFLQEIDITDEVEMDIEEAEASKKLDESFKASFNTGMFKKGIQAVAPLTENMEFYGITDHPIIVSGQGSDPSKATLFEEKVDYWLLLAPTITTE